MSIDYELNLKKVSFITCEGNELTRKHITEDQYQTFCNEFEAARLENKINWPEMDERYKKLNENIL